MSQPLTTFIVALLLMLLWSAAPSLSAPSDSWQCPGQTTFTSCLTQVNADGCCRCATPDASWEPTGCDAGTYNGTCIVNCGDACNHEVAKVNCDAPCTMRTCSCGAFTLDSVAVEIDSQTGQNIYKANWRICNLCYEAIDDVYIYGSAGFGSAQVALSDVFADTLGDTNAEYGRRQVTQDPSGASFPGGGAIRFTRLSGDTKQGECVLFTVATTSSAIIQPTYGWRVQMFVSGGVAEKTETCTGGQTPTGNMVESGCLGTDALIFKTCCDGTVIPTAETCPGPLGENCTVCRGACFDGGFKVIGTDENCPGCQTCCDGSQVTTDETCPTCCFNEAGVFGPTNDTTTCYSKCCTNGALRSGLFNDVCVGVSCTECCDGGVYDTSAGTDQCDCCENEAGELRNIAFVGGECWEDCPCEGPNGTRRVVTPDTPCDECCCDDQPPSAGGTCADRQCCCGGQVVDFGVCQVCCPPNGLNITFAPTAGECPRKCCDDTWVTFDVDCPACCPGTKQVCNDCLGECEPPVACCDGSLVPAGQEATCPVCCCDGSTAAPGECPTCCCPGAQAAPCFASIQNSAGECVCLDGEVFPCTSVSCCVGEAATAAQCPFCCPDDAGFFCAEDADPGAGVKPTPRDDVSGCQTTAGVFTGTPSGMTTARKVEGCQPTLYACCDGSFTTDPTLATCPECPVLCCDGMTVALAADCPVCDGDTKVCPGTNEVVLISEECPILCCDGAYRLAAGCPVCCPETGEVIFGIADESECPVLCCDGSSAASDAECPFCCPGVDGDVIDQSQCATPGACDPAQDCVPECPLVDGAGGPTCSFPSCQPCGPECECTCRSPAFPFCCPDGGGLYSPCTDATVAGAIGAAQNFLTQDGCALNCTCDVLCSAAVTATPLPGASSTITFTLLPCPSSSSWSSSSKQPASASASPIRDSATGTRTARTTATATPSPQVQSTSPSPSFFQPPSRSSSSQLRPSSPSTSQPPPQPSSSSSSSSSSNLSPGAIVGIAVGVSVGGVCCLLCIVAVAAAVGVGFSAWLWREHRASPEASSRTASAAAGGVGATGRAISAHVLSSFGVVGKDEAERADYRAASQPVLSDPGFDHDDNF